MVNNFVCFLSVLQALEGARAVPGIFACVASAILQMQVRFLLFLDDTKVRQFPRGVKFLASNWPDFQHELGRFSTDLFVISQHTDCQVCTNVQTVQAKKRHVGFAIINILPITLVNYNI